MKKYKAIDKNGKELNFTVPTKWEDVPFNEFLRFFNHQEDLSFVISVLTGLPTDFIDDPEYIDFTSKVLVSINDMGNLPDLKADPKPMWEYEGRYAAIDHSSFKWSVSLGQQVDAMSFLQGITEEDSEGNPIQPSHEKLMSIFPNICAIFMQPYFFGKEVDKYDSTRFKYDHLESEKLVTYFENYNFVDVVRLGGFFLSKLQKSKTGLKTSSPRMDLVKRKLMQGMKTLLKPLVSFRCYIASLKVAP